MEIKYCKCYNPKAETEIEPKSWLKSQLGVMNSIIKYLTELKPDFVDEYIQLLIKRVTNALASIEKKDGFYDFIIDEVNFEYLDKYLKLRRLTKEFLLAHVNPMKKSLNDSEKYLVYGYNHSMAFRRISYHSVKAFAELLGKEEGIKLYTKIITRMIEDASKRNPQKSDISTSDYCKRAIKSWCDYGMADFSYIELDEHKTIFRFDSCFAHEVLKDFNDPDIAYYASCYVADLPAFNEGKIIKLRRTQTLHHSDFCDELYWDSRYHDNPEHPTKDFLEKMIVK